MTNDSLPPSLPAGRAPAKASRRGLLLGAGACAAVAGAGLAWWRLRPHAVEPGAMEGFWGLQFQALDGSALPMTRFRNGPLLVNFWATWCPPCIEELPMINGFFHKQRAKGWQVLGLAVDQQVAVERFLVRQPLDFPVALAGLAGTELSRSLGNLSGGLPFTVVFDTGGQVRQRKMGKLSTADLAAWAAVG
jgi:thiol-disulfide isomerase/thioredoxin